MSLETASIAQRKEAIREILEDAVDQNGITLTELGRRVQWSRGHVSNIIKGHRNLDLLDWLDLCKALEIDPERFIAELKQKLQP